MVYVIPPSTPLALAAVRLVRTNTLRVTFSCAVRALDPRAPYDATNPKNWTILRVGPGYIPPILRIDPVDGDPASVDLQAMVPFAPGQLFTADATGPIAPVTDRTLGVVDRILADLVATGFVLPATVDALGVNPTAGLLVYFDAVAANRQSVEGVTFTAQLQFADPSSGLFYNAGSSFDVTTRTLYTLTFGALVEATTARLKLTSASGAFNTILVHVAPIAGL